MSELTDHTNIIRQFCQERDWGKNTNPKDVALSLVLESAEVLENFQWIKESSIDAHSQEHKAAIADELADVYYWTLYLCDRLDIDLAQAFKSKMLKNEQKYPADKVKGKNTNKHTHKYTRL